MIFAAINRRSERGFPAVQNGPPQVSYLRGRRCKSDATDKLQAERRFRPDGSNRGFMFCENRIVIICYNRCYNML